MENVIQKDEENIKNSIGYKAIHEYLQKYKVVEFFFLLTFHILGLVHSKELKTQIMHIRVWSGCFIHSDQIRVQG